MLAGFVDCDVGHYATGERLPIHKLPTVDRDRVWIASFAISNPFNGAHRAIWAFAVGFLPRDLIHFRHFYFKASEVPDVPSGIRPHIPRVGSPAECCVCKHGFRCYSPIVVMDAQLGSNSRALVRRDVHGVAIICELARKRKRKSKRRRTSRCSQRAERHGPLC